MCDTKESLFDDSVTFLGSVCNWISYSVRRGRHVLLHTILSLTSLLLCLVFILPHPHFLAIAIETSHNVMSGHWVFLLHTVIH